MLKAYFSVASQDNSRAVVAEEPVLKDEEVDQVKDAVLEERMTVGSRLVIPVMGNRRVLLVIYNNTSRYTGRPRRPRHNSPSPPVPIPATALIGCSSLGQTTLATRHTAHTPYPGHHHRPPTCLELSTE